MWCASLTGRLQAMVLWHNSDVRSKQRRVELSTRALEPVPGAMLHADGRQEIFDNADALVQKAKVRCRCWLA